MKKTYQKKDKEELKKVLTPLQYGVTQEALTEPPFQNEYYKTFGKGLYVDITTGQPLFLSMDKFDAGCGWPSFTKPVEKDAVVYVEDHSHGMSRIEVRSKIGDAHLGHVFEDGPRFATGLRYCMNSAALRFIPVADLEKEGYEEYLKYFEE